MNERKPIEEMVGEALREIGGEGQLSDYTSLALGSGWGLIVFLGTLFYMRRKRLRLERDKQERSTFPEPPTAQVELAAQR